MFIGQVEETGVIEPVVFPRVVPADEPRVPPTEPDEPARNPRQPCDAPARASP